MWSHKTNTFGWTEKKKTNFWISCLFECYRLFQNWIHLNGFESHFHFVKFVRYEGFEPYEAYESLWCSHRDFKHPLFLSFHLAHKAGPEPQQISLRNWKASWPFRSSTVVSYSVPSWQSFSFQLPESDPCPLTLFFLRFLWPLQWGETRQ